MNAAIMAGGWIAVCAVFCAIVSTLIAWLDPQAK